MLDADEGRSPAFSTQICHQNPLLHQLPTGACDQSLEWEQGKQDGSNVHVLLPGHKPVGSPTHSSTRRCAVDVLDFMRSSTQCLLIPEYELHKGLNTALRVTA